MIYYRSVKFTIKLLILAKMIITMVLHYNGVPESIAKDKNLLFISKFCSLIYYFLGIKKKLFTAFYL